MYDQNVSSTAEHNTLELENAYRFIYKHRLGEKRTPIAYHDAIITGLKGLVSEADTVLSRMPAICGGESLLSFLTRSLNYLTISFAILSLSHVAVF